MENILEVKNLSKTYPGFKLDNITFNVPKGTIIGIVGENGAGKTTTIKAILNIINKEGTVKIFGKNIKENEKEIKQNIGVVLDDSFLSQYLSPKNIGSVMKDFYQNWDQNKYLNFLKEFKLPQDKLLKDFSSGMKMKLKIACALAHNPKFLILDEATSGLDPIVRMEVLDYFRKFISEDETRSILMSSHITSDLENIADYIIFIHDGKIIFNLPTNELLENYGLIKCTKEDFDKLGPNDYITFKKEKYNIEVLVADKNYIKKKYKFLAIDKPTIDEIILLYCKGERK